MAFKALECFTAILNAPFLAADTALPLDVEDAVIVCSTLGSTDHSYITVTDNSQCATFKVICSNGTVVAVDRTDGLSFPTGSCVSFGWSFQAVCDAIDACDAADACTSPIVLPSFDNTIDCNPLDCVRLSDKAAALLDPLNDTGCSTCIATTQYVCDRITQELGDFCTENPCGFLVVPTDGSCIQGVTPPDECGCDTCLATTEWVCNYLTKQLTDFQATLPDACNLITGVYGSSTAVPVVTVGPDGCITSITTLPISVGGSSGGVESVSVCSALVKTGTEQNPTLCLAELHASNATVNGITYDVYGRVVNIDPLIGSITGLNAGSHIIITPVGGGVYSIATNDASTVLAGSVRLATDGEAVAGLQNDIAVTPTGLKAVRDSICNDLSCANIGQLDRFIFSTTVTGGNTITIAGVNLAANETLIFHAHMYGDITIAGIETGNLTYEISAGGGVLDTRVVSILASRNVLAFQQKFAVVGPFSGNIAITITAVDGTINNEYGVIDGSIYINCECS